MNLGSNKKDKIHSIHTTDIDYHDLSGSNGLSGHGSVLKLVYTIESLIYGKLEVPNANFYDDELRDPEITFYTDEVVQAFLVIRLKG